MRPRPGETARSPEGNWNSYFSLGAGTGDFGSRLSPLACNGCGFGYPERDTAKLLLGNWRVCYADPSKGVCNIQTKNRMQSKQNKRNKHVIEEQAILSIHRTRPDGKSRTQNVSK